jgi:hypothetical protein
LSSKFLAFSGRFVQIFAEMKPFLVALLAVFCGFAAAGIIGSTQSVAVIGRLFCKGNYTEKHWVSFWGLILEVDVELS